MTKVKICGITCRKEIEMLNELKPDFAGFVFAQSRRQLKMDEAASLCALLDPSIQKVGVFVNETRCNVMRIKEACGLDILQLHGDEPPKDCFFEGCIVWKAIRVKDIPVLHAMKKYNADAFLLDAYSKETYGGTGKTFDWTLVQSAGSVAPVILAGGLNAGNVREAIEIVHPYAVDASSGVETGGKKDFEKIKKFIAEARGNPWIRMKTGISENLEACSYRKRL